MSLFYTNSNTFLHHNSYISLKSPKNNFLTPKYCHKITQKKYSPFLSLSHTQHTQAKKINFNPNTHIYQYKSVTAICTFLILQSPLFYTNHNNNPSTFLHIFYLFFFYRLLLLFILFSGL